MHLIYCYQRKTNNKRYIGQTIDLAKRHQNHLVKRRSGKANLLIEKKITQYGMEEFTLTVLEEHLSQEQANEREIYWIAFYKTNICRFGPDFGYNLCDGGKVRSGHRLSEETKRKISEAQAGSKNIRWGIPLTDEQKQKLSTMFTGAGNPMYNKKHTDESREKLKQSHLGLVSGNKDKKWTMEMKNKNSMFTPEEIEKIKRLYDDKVKIQVIAEMYNCGRHSITELSRRNNWPLRRKQRLTSSPSLE